MTDVILLGRRLPRTARGVFELMALAVMLLSLARIAFGDIAIPPPPDVPPIITYPFDQDSDLDGVDDQFAARLRELRSSIGAETDPSLRAKLIAQLQDRVKVEVLLSEPVTQADIDAFVQAGGHVEYVFRRVSYGWGGTMALAATEQLPRAMRRSFVALLKPALVHTDLDEATRTGRARPVWAAGFAGSASGFRGNATTTIAIIDTGVDGTHTDLTGRAMRWMDWFEGAGTPVDYDGHGTHAAGIAVGSGSVAGVSPTTLRLTDSGDLSSVTGFNPWPFHIPAGSATMAMTATFLGGGNATLGYAYSDDGVQSYTLGGGSVDGKTPLSTTANFTATASRHYTTYLAKKTGTVSKYAVAASTTFAGLGDGFPVLSGVAPGCMWAAHKVYANDGSGGDTTTIGYALDDCVAYGPTYNIKIINISLSTTSVSSSLRNKVNTVVTNGLIVVASAGNSGPSTAMTDPARARLAITVGANNDVNALTDYTSTGSFTQEWNTDYKPDLCAPGGSKYYTNIMSVDANQSDAGSPTFGDVYANDYTNIRGTSMSAPFVAGAAALVIDALEARGLTWAYVGDSQPRLVKMLLCATATETNANREGGTNSPTLGRAATAKDIYEGYGVLNCDAAVEAAYQSINGGDTITGTTTGDRFDRRAWARKVSYTAGSSMTFALTVPSTADYDLYLYSGTPDGNGNPVILASSTSAGQGPDESCDYTAPSDGTAYLVVKRVSGSGGWSLTYTLTAPAAITVTSPNGGETWEVGSSHSITWTFAGSPGANVKIDLYKGGLLDSVIVASTPLGSSGSGSYSWVVPTGQAVASDYRVKVSSTSSAVEDSSDGDFSLTKAATALSVPDRAGAVGSTVTLSATLTRADSGAGIASRSVSFTVSGTPVGGGSTNGSGVATVDYAVPEGVGGKTLGAAFAGDDTYLTSGGTGTLTVTRADTQLTAPDRSGRFGDNITLAATLQRACDGLALAGRTVSFTVEGSGAGSGTTDAGGTATASYLIPEALGAGAKAIGASFAGDASYNASTGSGTLTVSKWPTTTTASAASGTVGQTITLSAVLTRSDTSAPVAGRTISFTVEGTAAGSGSTNASGVGACSYAVPETLGSGAKSLQAAFSGDALYEGSSGSSTLTVAKANTSLYATDRSGTITDTVTLRQYDLKRATDLALLSGKTIVYRVDGTSVGTATTDAGGDSVRNWVITSGPATRTITVEFEGDAAHNASSANATLTCLSWTTKMVTFSRTSRITDRTELKARLLRSDNVPVFAKTIGFYVDGTFIISRSTNTDGYASYPYYDVPDGSGAGTRTIACEWLGDGGYAAVTRTATLTVLKAIPYVWVLSKSVTRGGIANLYAYFRRLYDYRKQENKPVAFSIDGSWIADAVTGTVASGEPGVARYLYNTAGLSLGAHTVRCEFAGDAWVDAGYGQGNLNIL